MMFFFWLSLRSLLFSCVGDDAGPLIERDPILQHMGNVCLALHVLGEYVNPSSPWLPYLRLLPASYTTTLYFTPEHYQALKGSPVLGKSYSVRIH